LLQGKILKGKGKFKEAIKFIEEGIEISRINNLVEYSFSLFSMLGTISTEEHTLKGIVY
jgi:hypothetical protein